MSSIVSASTCDALDGIGIGIFYAPSYRLAGTIICIMFMWRR